MHDYKDLPTNLFLSITGGTLGFVINESFLAAIILPCAFFVIGKTIDVFLKIYLERKKK